MIDRYFIEHRAKVLDLAAFLDRVDRALPAAPADGGEGSIDAGRADFRLESLRAAIELLLDGRPERARRVLELWSDPSSDPIERAPTKGAAGAWPGFVAGAAKGDPR